MIETMWIPQRFSHRRLFQFRCQADRRFHFSVELIDHGFWRLARDVADKHQEREREQAVEEESGGETRTGRLFRHVEAKAIEDEKLEMKSAASLERTRRIAWPG